MPMVDVNTLPESFLRDMKELLKNEYDEFLRSYENKAYRGIRLNRNKVASEDDEVILDRIFDGPKVKIPWTDNGYYLPEECNASKHPYYAAGLFYIQEPSAMSPASVLPVCKEDMVLDLCAAPGGKATQLCSRAGFVLANDISATRARSLLRNLELSGNDNFAVSAENPAHLASVYPEYFDKILVDAPCSGEGMFRKDPQLISSYRERGPEEYHPLQLEILTDAVKMLKRGGYLLYSTCTFSAVEDENTITELLKIYDDIHPVEIDEDKRQYFSPGKMGIDEAARLFPHKLKGEGHFLCLLRKDGDSAAGCSDNLEYREQRIDERLYRIPACFKTVSGIRYLRTGLLMGEEKKGRFSYSHPYALSPLSEGFETRLNLELSDDRVMRYLKGETIMLTEEDGLAGKKGECLVCVDYYPLGFGKIAGDKLKNNYPAALVWR